MGQVGHAHVAKERQRLIWLEEGLEVHYTTATYEPLSKLLVCP